MPSDSNGLSDMWSTDSTHGGQWLGIWWLIDRKEDGDTKNGLGQLNSLEKKIKGTDFKR